MRKNNFKKGMAAGAKPFEEKFKIQSEAIERVGKELHGRLDEFDSINDVIIDDLTSIEKKRLYDLNTVVDIEELDEAEREFLLALLLTISNMATKTNDLQKHFVRSVKNYLDVVSPQSEINIASIENVESLNSQKAIVQTIMEYLFLEQENHDYLEKYSDLLSYFSVNNRGIKEIIGKINVIYEATGAIGISENYGYIPVEEVLSETVNKEKERVGYGEPVVLKGLQEELISESLNISLRDEVVFENKSILIKETIKSEGVLRFVNCEISVDANLKTAINLSSPAKVYFDNCFIDYEGVEDQQFLLAEEGAKVELLDSEIYKGNHFISENSNYIELHLIGCYSKNLSTIFTKSRGNKSAGEIGTSFIIMEDCKFFSNNDGIGEPDAYKNSQQAFSSESLDAKDSWFENFNYGVFEVTSREKGESTITDCVFKNSEAVLLHDSDFKDSSIKIQKCKFYECIDSIDSGAENGTAIVDSLFEDCVGELSASGGGFILRDSIIEGGYSQITSIAKLIIDNCTFANWDLLKNIDKLSNINSEHATTFQLSDGSEIRNSQFININLADAKSKLRREDGVLCSYLIGSGIINMASDSIPDGKFFIENTVFKNIDLTKKILRKTERYSLTTGTLFRRTKEVVRNLDYVKENCEGI